jgi:hypothetical protein
MDEFTKLLQGMRNMKDYLNISYKAYKEKI